MARKTKLAKSRLDKYYNLAKEQGYRARSAYKLIQISKKYAIFKDCQTLIDLCAAPGGWLQVASNTMPMDSLIIGVDLVPIKPIKNVTTFQADITTQYAKQMLLKQMKGSKADVVLHDGSPNVGSNWNLDAFNQNQLVLSATSLACNLLKKGGAYVTKVFRSADYSSIIWVLQELFHIVKATKPQSSRNVSAEIFVICMQYKSPQFLDPKLFDYKHVFKNRGLNPNENLVEREKSKSLSYLLKLKKQNKRQGYSKGDDYREVSVLDFLITDNPADILVNYNKIKFTGSEASDIIRNHALTTDEIMALVEDLQVIGKKDMLQLLKWRVKLLKAIKDEKLPIPELLAKIPKIQPLPKLDSDDLEQVDGKLENKTITNINKVTKSMKKKQKKFLENLKNKSQIPQIEDVELFSITKQSQLLLQNTDDIDVIDDYESGDEVLIENETYVPLDMEDDNRNIEELEEDFAIQKERLKIKAEKAMKMKTRREASYAAQIQYLNEKIDRIEREGFKPYHSDSEHSDAEESDISYVKGFDNSGVEDNKIGENSKISPKLSISTNKIAINPTDYNKLIHNDLAGKKDSVEAERWFKHELFSISDELITNSPIKTTENMNIDNKEFAGNSNKSSADDDTANKNVKKPKVDTEQIQLIGPLLISKKSRLDLMDGLYNRYTYHEEMDELPSWFREDEEAHTKVQLPLTKEQMRVYKMKLKEIKSLPIRKVREAISRKIKKVKIKLDKVRTDTERISNANDASAIHQIEKNKKIVSKVMKDTIGKKNKVYVVSNKMGVRSQSVGGKTGKVIKLVDKRMKKDNWKAKKAKKTGRRKGRSRR